MTDKKPKAYQVNGKLKKPPRNAVAILTEAASRGANQRALATAVGCSPQLLKVWMDDYPEIKDAVEVGRSIEHGVLHGALLDAATKGNITAAIFLLKARHGYIEGQQPDQANRVSINFSMPGALSVEEFKDITPKREAIDHE